MSDSNRAALNRAYYQLGRIDATIEESRRTSRRARWQLQQVLRGKAKQ